MFCMNCGQILPDGAKFCLNCGTPQGAVSPIENTPAETINLDGNRSFVPAMCPNCNAHMNVDSSSKIARCDACGTECLVQDAIKTLNVKGNIQVGNATINVNGTNTDSLLQRVEMMLADGDFSGAMQKCDTILDTDPTNGRAYFYMLMCNLSCRNRRNLADQSKIYDGNPYYIKAMKFGDEDLRAELQSYLNSTIERMNAKPFAPGSIISYGAHNGNELYWRILKVNDGMALVISNDIIANMPFNNTGKSTNWVNCTLRNWLNNDFVNEYFSAHERDGIVTTTIGNKANPDYMKRLICENTTDKIFLLSIFEARTLFPNDVSRSVGADWWLRTTGCDSNHAACVNQYGNVVTKGLHISGIDSAQGGCVRPAMWIKI